MTGPQQLAAVVGWTPRPAFALATGTISQAYSRVDVDGTSVVVTGVISGDLFIPPTRFSSVFANEVAAHLTGLAGTNIIGRRVELHFIDGQFFIAYTIGG